MSFSSVSDYDLGDRQSLLSGIGSRECPVSKSVYQELYGAAASVLTYTAGATAWETVFEFSEKLFVGWNPILAYLIRKILLVGLAEGGATFVLSVLDKIFRACLFGESFSFEQMKDPTKLGLISVLTGAVWQPLADLSLWVGGGFSFKGSTTTAGRIAASVSIIGFLEAIVVKKMGGYCFSSDNPNKPNSLVAAVSSAAFYTVSPIPFPGAPSGIRTIKEVAVVVGAGVSVAEAIKHSSVFERISATVTSCVSGTLEILGDCFRGSSQTLGP